MNYTGLNRDTLCLAPDETLITEARHSGDALHQELAARLEREIGLHADVSLRLTDALKGTASESKSWVERYIDTVIKELKPRTTQKS